MNKFEDDLETAIEYDETIQDEVLFFIGGVLALVLYLLCLKLSRFCKTKEDEFKTKKGFIRSIFASDHYNEKIVRSRFIDSARHLKEITGIDLSRFRLGSIIGNIDIDEILKESNLYYNV